ncbi:MAG: hypothetical protein Athens101428_758 [Candidatus Berkelbacteria bacterium Athens1014_28]|uniref:Uncharacterized protein n=1 Tax=Candidatus Berkelbacteria bacterium Athens1014_28 TaxID=2017145 RepID=A0A554LJJ1_9BACT|nr:MAG: hypothetical protein Athens101428_758 [Candidatus Berkelbacteria bacterium Athens1014_28]
MARTQITRPCSKKEQTIRLLEQLLSEFGLCPIVDVPENEPYLLFLEITEEQIPELRFRLYCFLESRSARNAPSTQEVLSVLITGDRMPRGIPEGIIDGGETGSYFELRNTDSRHELVSEFPANY